MKIIVIGHDGPIGASLIAKLCRYGHEAVGLSLSELERHVTNESFFADTLIGAEIVVEISEEDLMNGRDPIGNFSAGSCNLLSAEAAAGIGYHVLLFIFNGKQSFSSRSFRKEIDLEDVVKASSVPCAIIRAPGIKEFVREVTDTAFDGQSQLLPVPEMQAIVTDYIADVLVRVTLSTPINSIFDLAGPEQTREDEIIRQFLIATGDPRAAVDDSRAPYFCTQINDLSLAPSENPRLGATRASDWLVARQGSKTLD